MAIGSPLDITSHGYLARLTVPDMVLLPTEWALSYWLLLSHVALTQAPVYLARLSISVVHGFYSQVGMVITLLPLQLA